MKAIRSLEQHVDCLRSYDFSALSAEDLLERLKVVDDQIGCPTWTVELANAIVKIIKEKMPYGTYHTCGSGHTSWFGFAQKIFELYGINVNLIPCTTNEFPRKAKRPANSIMENNRICRKWETALKEYMELRCE